MSVEARVAGAEWFVDGVTISEGDSTKLKQIRCAMATCLLGTSLKFGCRGYRDLRHLNSGGRRDQPLHQHAERAQQKTRRIPRKNFWKVITVHIHLYISAEYIAAFPIDHNADNDRSNTERNPHPVLRLRPAAFPLGTQWHQLHQYWASSSHREQQKPSTRYPTSNSLPSSSTNATPQHTICSEERPPS